MDYKDTDTPTDTAWTELPATHTHTHTSSINRTLLHNSGQGVFIIFRLFSGWLEPSLFLMFYILTAVVDVLFVYKWKGCHVFVVLF